uniref:Splicing factor Cactin n=1 Tax=Trichuris muris TaxID=70415 RepID=A0A5S6Q2U6_TRIMR
MEADTKREMSHSSHHRKEERHKKAKVKEASLVLPNRLKSPDRTVRIGRTNDEDTEFFDDLREMRAQTKARKKRQKELFEALETPAEKRARRLAKKKAKTVEALPLSLVGPGEDTANDNNPYGDPELTHPFVWQKKLEVEGLSSISPAELACRSRKVLEANRMQLDKIKMDRMMRDKLKADAEMIRRDRDGQQNVEWSEQETRFHLEQARERSKIRLKDDRAKPIDYLAAYVYCLMEGEDWVDDDYVFLEPQEYCQNLSLKDCEDLIEDIDVYKRLQNGAYDHFWNNIIVVVNDCRKQQAVKSGLVRDSRQAVSSAVMSDIERIFDGKTFEQLSELETHVVAKIQSAEDGLDVAYWETLLSLLRVRIAVTRLRQIHDSVAESNEERMLVIEQSKDEPPKADVRIKIEPGAGENPGPSCVKGKRITKIRKWSEMDKNATDNEMIRAYRDGRYSPVYVSRDSLPPQARIVVPTKPAKPKESNVSVDEKRSIEAFENFARKGMGDDEATFAVEYPVEQDVLRWSNRFLPRKPRYFNRVHTGFEWNKYNQTHYDLDNPPPKIVQGYKFNVFYPDLLEPKPPQFTILPCKDDSDFCIIKFHAGPPYEDVAFKIVKREWEISQKKGYRCIFQNGIFQLWFQFKKYRYRR